MNKKLVWISLQSSVIASIGFLIHYIVDFTTTCYYDSFLAKSYCVVNDLFLVFWVLNVLSFFVASLYAGYKFDQAKINSGIVIAILASISTFVLSLLTNFILWEDYTLFIFSLIHFLFLVFYGVLFQNLKKR